MAVIECPGCGTDVDDAWDECPACGGLLGTDNMPPPDMSQLPETTAEAAPDPQPEAEVERGLADAETALRAEHEADPPVDIVEESGPAQAESQATPREVVIGGYVIGAVVLAAFVIVLVSIALKGEWDLLITIVAVPVGIVLLVLRYFR